MKEKNMLEYPYEIKSLPADRASMDLIDLPNQRQIRNTQVQSIFRLLESGEHFDSPFVVNVINGTKRIRVIDGGHRTMALIKYFEKHPDRKVKISLVVYKDLTQAEERKIYSKWNLGMKQSIDDFINSYRLEIPEYENIMEELPVSVYGSKNKMKIRHLVAAYFISKQKTFIGITGVHSFEFIEQFKKVDYSDVESIKNTFSIIKEIFNPEDIIDFTRLPAFKSYIFNALFHLVSNNKVLLGRNYVVKRMKTVLYRTSELDTFKHYSRQGSVEVYNRCKQLLNDGVDHQFK